MSIEKRENNPLRLRLLYKTRIRSEFISSFSAFIAGGFIDALPGIILQLVLIPLIMLILNKRRIIR